MLEPSTSLGAALLSPIERYRDESAAIHERDVEGQNLQVVLFSTLISRLGNRPTVKFWRAGDRFT
jgi:hypothetical protein